MPESLVILFIVAAVAFALSAVCGGGAGLILIPVLGYFLPVTSVPAALSIGTASSSASRIFAFHKNIRWDIVKIFVPASIPAVWLGSWLLQFLNPLYLQLIMGLFLVSNVGQLFRKEKRDITQRQPLVQLAFIGFLVGFVSGITGAVGLLFNRFYLKQGLTKNEIIATRACNEIMLHIIKLGLYAFFGLFSLMVLYYGLAIALAAILSSWLMKWLLPKLTDNIFKKIGYSAMVISGISLLGESGSKVLAKENADIDFTIISKGVESKIAWANKDFSFEFVYNEGFEYEQVIPFSALPEDKKRFVQEQSQGADKIVLEEVFGINEHSYELLMLKNGKIVEVEFK